MRRERCLSKRIKSLYMENKDMPAFPQSCSANEYGIYLASAANISDTNQVVGLSKREHFAAMAMQGMLSNPKLDIETTPAETIARDAIVQADVLLLELSKPQP